MAKHFKDCDQIPRLLWCSIYLIIRFVILMMLDLFDYEILGSNDVRFIWLSDTLLPTMLGIYNNKGMCSLHFTCCYYFQKELLLIHSYNILINYQYFMSRMHEGCNLTMKLLNLTILKLLKWTILNLLNWTAILMI